MSWLSEWANKAENLLNTLDNSAAEAFKAHRGQSSPSVIDNSPSSRSDLPQTIKTFESFSADRNQFDSQTDLRSYGLHSIEPTQIPIGEHAAPELRWSPKPQSSSVKASTVLEDSFDQLLGTTEATKSHALSESVHTGDDKASSSGYETLDSARFPSFGYSGDNHPTRMDERKPVTPKKTNVVQEIAADTKLENKLLRSEVSSLSQEVSGLLKRNHKVVEENKELRGQVERLTNQLRDSDAKLRELQVNMKELSLESNNRPINEQETVQLKAQLAATKTELETLRAQLDSSRSTTIHVESSLQEARRQNEIAEKRAELAQKEANRVIKELAQYKEKATHILTMKENLIASLRAADGSPTGASEAGGVDQEMMDALRAECDMLREEVSRWRIEVDHRELATQELEVQMQAERESLRRNLDMAEQQAEREKQLREDADSELAQIRLRLREYENNMSRQKADWHAQLTASEAELGRLRQALSRQHSSGSSTASPGDQGVNGNSRIPTRTDPEHILLLESRLRQLSDNLLTKQDALESVLAQNHALKIRLERAQTDNESLASALSTQASSSDVHVRLPYQTGAYGCARLALHNSPIPRSLRPIPLLLDDMSVRVTNLLRRWPLARMLFFVYTVFLHLWLLWAMLIYLPPPQPLSRNT